MSGSELWDERVTKFADAIGLGVDETSARLVRIVGEAGDEAAALLADARDTPDELVRAEFPEVPPAKLNRALRKLRTSSAETAAEAAPSFNVVLPRPPDDESFLAALKVGGIAKVSATDVNAALRALLARNLGVFEIPERLLEAMEAHAESLGEPVDESFYTIQRTVTERRYGDILSALGVHGRFVSEARKRRLFQRMEPIWEVLAGFQHQLEVWQRAWTEKVSNPAALMTSMATIFGGGALGPPNLMDHPDVGPVRDAAEAVIDAVNQIFAGTGIPVARALAYDALRVKQIVENPDLPAAVGATTREEMLRKLDLGVTADYVRLERDLATYVMAVLELPGLAEQNVPGYLVALQQLGATIPWDKLKGDSDTPGTGHRPF